MDAARILAIQVGELKAEVASLRHEYELQQAKEAIERLSNGKPLGELVGKQTIINMANEILELKGELAKTHRLWQESCTDAFEKSKQLAEVTLRREETVMANEYLIQQLTQTREALELAIATFGHEHWDPTSQHGNGCEKCIQQSRARAMVAKALKGEEK